jgi:hypothetical protein
MWMDADPIAAADALGDAIYYVHARHADRSAHCRRERRPRSDAVECYALTNWSSETFPSQRRRFPFLALFDGTPCRATRA